jgi:hypothetical protein
MGETTHSEPELGQMQKVPITPPLEAKDQSSVDGCSSSRWHWPTAIFFVAGTLDSKLRYEWIGI